MQNTEVPHGPLPLQEQPLEGTTQTDLQTVCVVLNVYRL